MESTFGGADQTRAEYEDVDVDFIDSRISPFTL